MIPEIGERHAEIGALCRSLGVRRLEVFGSAATGGGFDAGASDLDFLVQFDLEQTPNDYADRYFALLESLQAMFGRSVDLVVDSAIKNPYFRESIERSKALVYAA